MSAAVTIVSATLPVAPDALAALPPFYGGWGEVSAGEGEVTVAIGDGTLRFVAGTGPESFHHFALLVPGDRFDAAVAWLARRAQLLPHDGASTVRFEDWDADAVYVHDPAGDIVELIAHRGIGSSGVGGPFDPARELLGISELGLVVDDGAAALTALESVGIQLFDGSVAGGGLGFAGEKGRVLILTPPDRGWMPTGRPARRAPAQAMVCAGGLQARVELVAGRVTVSPAR